MLMHGGAMYLFFYLNYLYKTEKLLNNITQILKFKL